MKLIMLLGFAALALAKIPSQSWEQENLNFRGELEETSFKRGSEYEFNYNGQVASGIPGSSRQHSATRVQARVSLVLKGEDKAILKIQQIRMGKLNEKMSNPRAMVPFMAFEEVELAEEMRSQLELPVMFSYQQGVVSDLVFDGQEKPWSANVKKGILNLLQVNLGKRGEAKRSEEASVLNEMPQGSQDPRSESFSTHEKTVEGDCETLYTVVSNPSNPSSRNVLNVTRTLDFENCKQRPEIKYNFRFQDPCESCEPKFADDQKFLKSSSVAKFNISGNREEFLIESAILESQYQMVPFNREGNMIVAYVNQTLTLARAGPIRSKNVKQPKNPQQSDSDLMYTLDWDKEMEEFTMKGHSQSRLPVDIKDRVKIVSEILRPLVSEMRECVSEEAPIQFAKLIKTLRLSEKPQLQEIFQHFVHSQPESFSTEEHQKIKAILTDALADAATKDTISFLLQLIREEKISPLRASLTIKHLINIRTPSKEIVHELLSFLESEVVQRNWILKQAAQLTLGSVVQGLCMPTEERLAILPRSSDKLPRRAGPNSHLCPQQLQDQLIEKFIRIVKENNNEENQEDAILALKTLGNMGIPKSVHQLEQLIKSKQQPTMIRIEAIMALRQLRETLPQKVQQILMPEFLNKQQENEIRVAAAYQLLQTLPKRPVLDQMARSLFTERSHQVASFVYTYMQTLANSTNPCEEKFARDLQLALRHGRKIAGAYMPQYSKYLHGSAYSKQFRMGADGNIASLVNNKTFVPQYASANLHVTAMGFWSRYLISVGVAQENMEGLIARYLRRTEFSDLSIDQILSRSPRSVQAPVQELKKIWKQLETSARQMTGSPKGFAFLKIKDQEFWMLPITQKSIQKLPSIQEIRRVLEEGSHFNIHKAGQLHELNYKIPTSIGFPMIVSVRIPSVAQISGQVRLETRNPFKLHLNNVKPSIATSVITVVSVWNPVVATGVKVVITGKVCTPMTAKVVVDADRSEPSIRLSLDSQQKSVELIKLETRPMTFTRQYRFPLTSYPTAQYKTIVSEEWNRINNVRESQIVRKTEQMVEQILGQKIRMEGVWHKTPMNGPAYLPVCPFTGPNHIVIRSEPGRDQPKEWVFKASASYQKSNEQKLRSEPFEMEDEQMNIESYESDKTWEAVIKSEMSTKGARQEREAKMVSKISFSPNLRVLKAQSEVEVSPIPEMSPRPVKLCTQASIQYPQSPKSFSELRGKSVVGQLKTTWGQGQCKEQNKVEIKMAAKHSQKQQQEQESQSSWYQQREEQPERNSPVELEQILSRQQQLFQYTMEAKYQNLSPVVKNVSAKAFNALKALYYWNTNEINFDIQNPENKIRAELTIDSQNQELFNLTVKTPVSNVTMTDAQLPIQMSYPVSMGRMQSELENPSDLLENLMVPMLPECRISSQRLQTFDRVSVRAPLSNCWTLLAKDCDNEAEPSFAVLVKKASPQSEKKVIKVLTPEHTITISPESSSYESLKVKVNGQQLSESELPQNQHIQIQKYGQQVKVTIPKAGVRVHFDGYSAKIQMSPAMVGRQCGICGDYDGESQDEFRTPQGQSVSDVRRFIQAHTLKDSKCEYPQELSQIDDSSEELSYEPRWNQEESSERNAEFASREAADSWEQDKSSSSSSEEEDREESFRPVQRRVTEEEGRKVCISTETIPRCPRNTLPQQWEQERRQVAFRCLDRSHPEAHRLLRIARQQSQLPQDLEQELSQQEPAYTSEYSVPKRCSRQ